VQVGNETRNGMLWPAGQLWTSSGNIPNGRQNFAKLLNAGYDAVKAVFPSCPVLAHLNNAFEDNAWWFEQVGNAGGKFDAIALSHYPQTESDWQKCNTAALQRIQALSAKFNKDVIISEVGVKTPANESLAAQVLAEFMTEAKKIGKCKGVFYWEPEVDGKWKPAAYGSLGWNPYDMGAFTTSGKATSVMEAFK
jgi:arabinogalactan endo-1,4-beta-galactosidase